MRKEYFQSFVLNTNLRTKNQNSQFRIKTIKLKIKNPKTEVLN